MLAAFIVTEGKGVGAGAAEQPWPYQYFNKTKRVYFFYIIPDLVAVV